MPRIKLAHWHGQYAPGEEVDVTDEELAALTRDGRVAEVLAEPSATPPKGTESAQPEPSPEPETESPVPESGRKRR